MRAHYTKCSIFVYFKSSTLKSKKKKGREEIEMMRYIFSNLFSDVRQNHEGSDIIFFFLVCIKAFVDDKV